MTLNISGVRRHERQIPTTLVDLTLPNHVEQKKSYEMYRLSSIDALQYTLQNFQEKTAY